MPQIFFGSAKGSPDRAVGAAFAACCARSDSGAFAEAGGVAGSSEAQRPTGFTTLHPQMNVLVAEAHELPGSSDGPDQTALGPHLRFCSMDSLQQMTFAEYCADADPDALVH